MRRRMRNKFFRWSLPVSQFPMGAANATTTDRSKSVHDDFVPCATGGDELGKTASALILLELLRLVLDTGRSCGGLSLSSPLISLEGSSPMDENESRCGGVESASPVHCSLEGKC